jgi:DR2241 stabilising domain
MHSKGEATSMGQICWEKDDAIWRVRHIQDQGVPFGKLRKLVGLDELEELVRWDGQGRYRPLRSEENLMAGWLFQAQGKEEFREVMEVIYPGLWGNAEAWKKKKLKVDAWDVALGKQTERLQKKAVQSGDMPQRVVEEHCRKRCLKTVVWAGELPEEKEGEMPMLCTGPCGLFWSYVEG